MSNNDNSQDWLKRHPKLSFFIIVLFILFFILINTDGMDAPEITSGSCSSNMKKAVADEYKSPSTVKFINCNWNKSKGIYGEADAQNGFGATIRTSFLCNGDSCLITEK